MLVGQVLNAIWTQFTPTALFGILRSTGPLPRRSRTDSSMVATTKGWPLSNVYFTVPVLDLDTYGKDGK